MTRAPPPDTIVRGPGLLALLDRHRRVMEAMFDDDGLKSLRAKKPLHPAIARFDAILQLRREAGRLSVPLHERALLQVTQQMLDESTWVPEKLGADFWSFLPDTRTRARTVGALNNEAQYDDTMAELFYWGWLRQQGYVAERRERDGLPDITVSLDGGIQVRAEVKRLRYRSAIRRVAEIIKKANKQLRRQPVPGSGVLFISLDIPLEPALPGDAVPESVQLYERAVRAATQSDNSSVGQVVITWEDFSRHGDPPDPVGYFVRRRSIAIEHAAPQCLPAIPSQQLTVGQTGLTSLVFRPAEGINQSRSDLLRHLGEVTQSDPTTEAALTRAPIEIGKHLTDQNALAGTVRQNHVRRAIAAPDGVSVYGLGEQHQVVLTKRVTSRTTDFVVVLIVMHDEPKWLVTGLVRLYDEPAVLDRLADSPNEAFSTMLERYGIRFKLAEHTVWWIPEFTVSADSEEPLTPERIMGHLRSAAGIEWGPESSMLSSLVKVTKDRKLVVAGMFWIHLDRYRAAVMEAARKSGR